MRAVLRAKFEIICYIIHKKLIQLPTIVRGRILDMKTNEKKKIKLERVIIQTLREKAFSNYILGTHVLRGLRKTKFGYQHTGREKHIIKRAKDRC